jgi:hypothetical protein
MQGLATWKFRAITTLAGIILAATSAQAFDLTGTWEGTYTCKGSNQGVKDAYEEALVAQITQAGNAIGAAITFSGTPYKYNGIAVANATKPDKGDVVLVLCGSDDDLSTGAYDEIGRFSIVTKPAKGTGSLKGSSQFSTPSPAAYTCKWKLKRTDPANPVVTTACP